MLQFHNVLIYVLLGAAGVTAALGHGVDTAVILGVVVINALIGFIQEGKAEKSLDAIRNMLSLHAMVMRDGRRSEIAAEELVPGDIVLLASGDKVPADLRLIEMRSLRIEEAALTGESQPVEKSPDVVAADAPIGDRTGMAYSGTLVVFGQSKGVVVATGDATEIGRNAIIRRMPAVETLGAVTTICSDKTGTLTKNEMTVQRLATADQFIDVAGVGYVPQGGFTVEGRELDPATLADVARIALLCNDASLREVDDEWTLEGDPTEGALLTLALKAGLDPRFEAEALPRVDVIPFESEHRFMATLHHDHAGHALAFVKSAPERIIGMCSMQGTWRSRVAMWV